MKRLAVLALATILLSAPLFAENLATVGTYTITDKDVKNFIDDLKKNGFPASRITEEYALGRLIDFRLGLIDAKSQMLEQDTKAKDAMDNALYTYYLDKNVDSKYKTKRFSAKEIMAYYQKNPLVKIQRLTYLFNPQVPGDIDKARSQINLLRSDIRSKKISFETALEKAQDKSVPNLTGTFDKVLINDLAPQEMIELKPLKPGEITPVMQGGKFFAIARVIKIYPFAPEYSDDINDRIKQELIVAARERLSKTLRQKYAGFIKVR